MASVSLFRKWRSQRFQDLVGQGPVVQTLRNVLAGGSPARAYLFCGPRGTGKTSSARIFAKALNCEAPTPEGDPCNQCSLCRQITDGSCLDVLEIDAASHTQVEKIREFIVEKVHFAPVSARYKVYIIDEVHKLSAASFNALLKTLEEPPAHVVFVLATTHPHEVLPTVLSRCQRYDFRPLDLTTIRERLLQVGRVEGLELAPEAADLVARAADGSLRDALVFLEQCVAYAGTAIGGHDVESILGLVRVEGLTRMVDALASGQAGTALGLLHALVDQGMDLKRLLQSLQDVLRSLLLIQAGAGDRALTQRLEHERAELTGLAARVGRGQVMAWLRITMQMLEDAREFTDFRLLWELNLVRMACPELDPGMEAVLQRLERLEQDRLGLRRGEESSMLASPAACAVPTPTSKAPANPSEVRGAGKENGSEPAPVPVGPGVRAAAARPAGPSQRARPARGQETPDEGLPRVATVEDRREATPESTGSGTDEVLEGNASREAGSAGDTPVNPGPSSARLAPEPVATAVATAGSMDAREFWRRFLLAIKPRDMRLHAVLTEARALEVTHRLRLGLPEGYKFHHEQILGARAMLEGLAEELLGRPVRLECVMAEGDSSGGPSEPGGSAPEPARPARTGGPGEHSTFVRRASGMFPGQIMESES